MRLFVDILIYREMMRDGKVERENEKHNPC